MAVPGVPPYSIPKAPFLPDYAPLKSVFANIPTFIPLAEEPAALRSLVNRMALTNFSDVARRCFNLVQAIILQDAILRAKAVGKASLPKSPKLSFPSVIALPLISSQLDEHLKKELDELFPFWKDLFSDAKAPYEPKILGILKGIKMLNPASLQLEEEKLENKKKSEEEKRREASRYLIIYFCFLSGYEDVLSFVLDSLPLEMRHKLTLAAITQKYEKGIYENQLGTKEKQQYFIHLLFDPYIARSNSQIFELVEAIACHRPELLEYRLTALRVEEKTFDKAFIEAARLGQNKSLKALCAKDLVTMPAYLTGFKAAASHGKKCTVELFLLNPDILDQKSYDEAFALASSYEPTPENETKYAEILRLLIEKRKVPTKTLQEGLFKLACRHQLDAIRAFLNENVPDEVWAKAIELSINWSEILLQATAKGIPCPQHYMSLDFFSTGKTGQKIIDAAAVGELKTLQSIFANEQSAELFFWEKGEAIIAASKGGHKEVVEFFFQFSDPADLKQKKLGFDQVIKDRDSDKFTCLYMQTTALLPVDRKKAIIEAAGGGHINILQLLTQDQNISYGTYELAIWSALKNKKAETASYLLESIKDSEVSIEEGVLKSMELFRTPGSVSMDHAKQESLTFQPALLSAVQISHVEGVRFLLSKTDISLDLFNRAFLSSCTEGNIEVAMIFVEANKKAAKEMDKATLIRATILASKLRDKTLHKALLDLQKASLAENLSGLSLQEEDESK